MTVSTANPDMALMRESPCERDEGGCGAVPGEPCVTRTGRAALYPHKPRVRAYAAKRWGTETDSEDSP